MHFTAILLVCVMPVLPGACDETNAIDVISTSVASELGCTMGWQELMARGSLREGIGDRFYIRTLCRRSYPIQISRPAERLEADNRR